MCGTSPLTVAMIECLVRRESSVPSGMEGERENCMLVMGYEWS